MALRQHRLLTYLAAQVLYTAMMILAVLLVITLTLTLAELLAEVADGELLASSLLTMLALRLPEAILLSAPLALVLGVVMSFGERAEGREFDAMRASGAKPGLIFAGVACPALIWAGILLILSGWLQPWSLLKSEQVAANMADDLLISSVRPGQFQTMAGGRLTVHAGQRDAVTGAMTNLFVRFSNGDQVEVITAQSGWIETDSRTGQRLLVLDHGRHLGHQAQTTRPYRVVDFVRNRIELPLPAAKHASNGEQGQPLHALTDLNDLDVVSEWQRRMIPVLSSVMLAMLALPVSLASARGHRWGAAVPAVLFYLLYSNAGMLVVAQAARGDIDMIWISVLHLAMALVVMVSCLIWWRRW